MPRKPFVLLALILTLVWMTLACNFPGSNARSNPELTIEAVRQTLMAVPHGPAGTPSPSLEANPAGAGETSPPVGTRLPPEPPTPYPADPGPTYTYDARWGDTLDGLAGRFGVEPGQITSERTIPVQGVFSSGQRLLIPNLLEKTSPAELLLPDSELVFSPSASDFDVAEFVNQAGGTLSRYRETLKGNTELGGAAIIQKVAAELSVNPRLLLALLEVRSHWVFGQPAGAAGENYPIGFRIPGRSGLYEEIKIAATQLNLAYYGWRAGTFTEVTFSNGQKVRLNPTLNAGSAALLHLFSFFSGQDGWRESLYSPDGFPARYQEMFGSPWARAADVEPLIPLGLEQPPLVLPFSPGEMWSLTAGPHNAWNYGTPRGGLDFSPITDEPSCAVSRTWVTASAPGVVVRAVDNAVALDLDGDGLEQTGWVLVYLHLAEEGLVAPGTWVETDQPLGHPSCEGGKATGKHVHLARKYNGEWLPADGPQPFVLSGWRAYAAERNYYGTLVKGEQEVTSDSSGRYGSTITR